MRWAYVVAGLLGVLAMSACQEWRETYEKDDDLPYGLDALPDVLRAAYPAAEYVELARRAVRNGELAERGAGDLYFAASGGLSYSNGEAEALAEFVSRGGTAVLATKAFSNKLAYRFAVDSCAFFVPLAGYNAIDTLEQVVGYERDSVYFPVLAYERDANSLSVRQSIRTAECYPEARDLLVSTSPYRSEHAEGVASWALSLPLGEGELVWLAVPIALTNVYVGDDDGQRVINEILHLLPARPASVLYDVDRESSEAALDYENQPPTDPSLDGARGEALLSQVLSRPPLAAAWYLLLLGFLAFAIVGSKRRQRLVPLAHARRNTTHEHLGNVTRLYLAKPDNPRMARKQLRLFEAFCNRRFGLRPLERPEDAGRLRELNGVRAVDVDTILRYHRSAERDQLISNTGFVQLVRILQDFYDEVGRART